MLFVKAAMAAVKAKAKAKAKKQTNIKEKGQVCVV